MQPTISVHNLSKVYDSGFQALKNVNLEIHRGEIFALLGPNGAGKTTLINIICGIVNPGVGQVLADGHDIVAQFRAARSRIGLVPQELTTDSFETVWDTTNFSRGLFGKAPNTQHIESVLRELSLWDKRHSRIMALSGGMKRRVMIAKALAHEPQILFLDEPTAGVDVELRRDMWVMVRRLRDSGVTISLTTHYIEEAEEMADRIGVWADNWEKLQVVPVLIVTPLAFLGGSFYSISMLPPLWQKITLFNPVVYLISGFRWSFYGVADVSPWISLAMTLVFMLMCLVTIGWIFRTGYRLKS